MNEAKPLTKHGYLSRMYSQELDYINKIILFQDFNFVDHGEIVVLLDKDFPNFMKLSEKKVKEIIFLYESSGWRIRLEKIKERMECLLIFT